MKQLLHPSLVLGARRPCMPHRVGLNKPLQISLEMRQQQFPWNLEFGCALTSLMAQAATPQRINEANFRVESSVRKQLPGMEQQDCRVNHVTNFGSFSTHRKYAIPVAESELVALGIEARLVVELDIQTEAGIMSVEATVEP